MAYYAAWALVVRLGACLRTQRKHDKLTLCSPASRGPASAHIANTTMSPCAAVGPFVVASGACFRPRRKRYNLTWCGLDPCGRTRCLLPHTSMRTGPSWSASELASAHIANTIIPMCAATSSLYSRRTLPGPSTQDGSQPPTGFLRVQIHSWLGLRAAVPFLTLTSPF